MPSGLVAYTGIMYNKDIFSKYNLQVPKTYSDFVHVADVLKSHGVSVITTGAKEAWPVNLMAYSIMAGYQPDQMATLKGLWTGSVKFTDPKMVLLLQHAQKFLSYMETNFTGEDSSAALGRFASGQTAMLLTGSWDAPTALSTNPGIQLGYFPTPLSDTASDNLHLQGKYADEWYIAAHSKNQDAALKWAPVFL
ncbi:hypothetical protein KDK_09240 [Dictyobacter kobayashii]|uniref:Probable sugar-binding periplasmic protein n=1 Tax=Dictyobacter kobayashii TaxID=2014872 RepID=A0A402ADE5_9CHLR|nr:hypothetical protein KDK_09240 [Dictyobacter kobayashii]